MHRHARRLLIQVERDEAIRPDDYQAFADAIARLDRHLEELVMALWDLLRYTDPLTGLATRYALLPRLEEERQRVLRTGRAASVCMIDLDRFKQVNDTHGHQAGDRVLEAVAAYLVGNLRRYDEVCRYGGEEFVLLLPDATPPELLPMVDRLRQGLAALAIILPEGDVIRMTASFGLARLSPDRSVHASLAEADRAMYRAKRGGRNRVCFATDDTGGAAAAAAGPATAPVPADEGA
jgi:diguanylate cyclase (GGDEF)-like protein